MVEPGTEARLELRHLVLVLSDLLNRAIATHGELSAREWEQVERAQAKAYPIKHPEVFSREEAEAIVRLRDASVELLEAARIALIALDLDPENSPPQWSPEDAGERLRSAIARAAGGS